MRDNLDEAIEQLYNAFERPEDIPAFLRNKIDIKKMAEYVTDRLTKAGVKVMRYDSITTNSIYLKFDYGVANSLRIGDHRGKEKYDYRYNLDSHRDKFAMSIGNKYTKYHYPFTQVDKLIEDVLKARAEKIKNFGEANYNKWMEESKSKQGNEAGFWMSATDLSEPVRKGKRDTYITEIKQFETALELGGHLNGGEDFWD